MSIACHVIEPPRTAVKFFAGRAFHAPRILFAVAPALPAHGGAKIFSKDNERWKEKSGRKCDHAETL